MNTFKRSLAVFLATSSIALALPLAATAGPMMGGGMEGACGQGRQRCVAAHATACRQ
jgi:hypothetical protein